MPGENDLGDLIVTLKLDDDEYRRRLKDGLHATSESIKRATVGTAQLTHGVRSLASTMTLVTGQTGFLAIEIARAGTHMVKLTSETGGFVSLLKGLVSLMASNPLTVAFLALAAIGAKVYNIWSDVSDKIAETRKRMAEAAKAEADATNTATKSMIALYDKLNVARGVISPQEARTREIERGIGPHPQGRELAEQQAALEFELTDLDKEKQARLESQKKLQAQSEAEWDRHERRLAAASAYYRERNEREDRIIEERKQEHRGRIIARSRMLRELEARRAGLLEKDEGGGGFGIGTLSSSGFRFGAGAIGSVIGEQNETKKTNALLEKSLQKLDAQITELRKLTEPSTGDN